MSIDSDTKRRTEIGLMILKSFDCFMSNRMVQQRAAQPVVRKLRCGRVGSCEQRLLIKLILQGMMRDRIKKRSTFTAIQWRVPEGYCFANARVLYNLADLGRIVGGFGLFYELSFMMISTDYLYDVCKHRSGR